MKKNSLRALSIVMVIAMVFGVVGFTGVNTVNADTHLASDLQSFFDLLGNQDKAVRRAAIEIIADGTAAPTVADPDYKSYVRMSNINVAEAVEDIKEVVLSDGHTTIADALSDAAITKAVTDIKNMSSLDYANFALTKLGNSLKSFTTTQDSNPIVAKIVAKFGSYKLYLNFLSDVKEMTGIVPLEFVDNNTVRLNSSLNSLILLATGLLPSNRVTEYTSLMNEYLDDVNTWTPAQNRRDLMAELNTLLFSTNVTTTSTPPVGGGGAPSSDGTSDAGKVTTGTTADGGKKVTLEVDADAIAKKITASTDGTVKLDLTAVKDAAAVSVEIPATAFAKIVEGNKSVTLQSEKAAVVLPVEVLKQIAQAGANGKVTINVNIVKDAPAVTSGTIVAPVIDFTINAGDKVVSSFDKAVKVSIKVDLPKIGDYRKVIAYYYNETAKGWEAVGGFVNKTTGELTFATSHFSKYTALEAKKSFPDVSTAWAKDSIEVLAAKNIMGSTGGDKFSPKANITRAEVAAILVRALNLDTKPAVGKFTDVASGKWYAKEVEAAANAGIIDGIGNNKFAPETEVTREQIATMIYRALEYKQGKIVVTPPMTFKDTKNISAFATTGVAVTAHKGIVLGSDNMFMPKDKATREQVSVMIYRMLEALGEM